LEAEQLKGLESNNQELLDIREYLTQYRDSLDSMLTDFQRIWPLKIEQTFVKKGKKILTDIEEKIHRISNIFDGTFFLNVSVLGNYGSGKSTFLNSLLHSPYNKGIELPHDQQPITCKLTEIRHGELMLSTEDGNGTIMEYDVDVSNINKVLEKFVSHKGDTTEKNNEKEDNIRKVILQTPFPDFIQGIRFYDTPGFDSPEKDELRMNAFAESDIVIWLIDINDGEIDTSLMDKMKNYEIFCERNIIILNKIDEKSPQEREIILEKIQESNPFKSEVLLYSAKQICAAEMLFTGDQVLHWISNWLSSNFKELDNSEDFVINYTNNTLYAKYGNKKENIVIDCNDNAFRARYKDVVAMLNQLHLQKRTIYINQLKRWKSHTLSRDLDDLKECCQRNFKVHQFRNRKVHHFVT
jgi:GTPase SAR1 family protein